MKCINKIKTDNFVTFPLSRLLIKNPFFSTNNCKTSTTTLNEKKVFPLYKKSCIRKKVVNKKIDSYTFFAGPFSNAHSLSLVNSIISLIFVVLQLKLPTTRQFNKNYEQKKNIYFHFVLYWLDFWS